MLGFDAYLSKRVNLEYGSLLRNGGVGQDTGYVLHYISADSLRPSLKFFLELSKL